MDKSNTQRAEHACYGEGDTGDVGCQALIDLSIYSNSMAIYENCTCFSFLRWLPLPSISEGSTVCS